MSFLDTQPAPIDSDGHDDPFAQFRSSHPREVLALLRELRDGGTPVALSSPGGTGLGATVWTVDSDRGRIAFDVEPQDPQLPGLVESNELTAVAYLDSVKLQFDLHDLVLVRSPRATAGSVPSASCVASPRESRHLLHTPPVSCIASGVPHSGQQPSAQTATVSSGGPVRSSMMVLPEKSDIVLLLCGNLTHR